MTAEGRGFVVSLSPTDHQRLLRLLGALAERHGRLPDRDGPRYADGPDLVGAALLVAERRPEFFDAVATELRRTVLRRGARGELLAICHELDPLVPRLDDPGLRARMALLVRELREVAVAIAVGDEPVGIAARLRVGARTLAELAPRAGAWTQPLQDLAGSLDDLQDALHPAPHDR